MVDTRFINDMLYGFEREFGIVFQLVQIDHVGSNFETGTNEIVERVNTVKGILLPHDVMRKFVYDVGFLRANSNFTYGGLDDILATYIIVRRKNLNFPYTNNLNHMVLYNNRRYDLIDITFGIQNCFSVLKLKAVEGAKAYQHLTMRTQDVLEFQELVGT